LSDCDIELVGFVKTFSKDSFPKQLPSVVTEAVPELLAYKMPERDKLHVLGAIRESADNGINPDALLCEAIDQAVEVLLDSYPEVPRSSDTFTVEDFIDVLIDLDPSKSSGFPSTLFAPKKGQIFDDTVLMLDLIEATMYRMMLLVTLGKYCDTPLEFHQCFLSDFINISIKEEPIKTSKQYGRLITAPGLVSTFCSAMLFRHASQALKDNLYESYSGIGIGFDKYHSMVLTMKHRDACIKSDVPKFDTTVCEYEAIKAAELRGRASGFGEKRSEMAKQLERSYFRKLFNVRGDIWCHNRTSWQPSGRWDTSDSNTAIRSIRAVAASLVSLCIENEVIKDYPLTSVGDDCEEPALLHTEEAYEVLGLPLRDVEKSNVLGLCSHVWVSGASAYSKRIEKGLYHMLLDINYETVSGFFAEYRSHPMYDQLVEKTFVVRPEVKMYIDRYLFESGESVHRPVYEECKPKVKQLAKKAAKKIARTGVRKLRQNVANLGLDEEHERILLGLTDPFSSDASEARYPDQGAGRSLTFQQRVATTAVSDVNGTYCISISLKPNYVYVVSSSSASNVMTWPATYSGNYSTNLINTYGQQYRPTSAGFRIVNSLSATDSKGYIVIAKGGPPVLGSTTTMVPQNFVSWDTHSNSHGAEYHATAHPLNANAYDFGDVATYATATAQEANWENVYFYASGLPANTTCFFVEIVLNYEYVPKEDSPIAQLAKAQPVMNVQLQTAINHVQQNLPSSHKDTTEKVRGAIKREAKKALVKHVLPFVARKAKQALL